MRGFLEVEAPDEPRALALVDALRGLDAEIASRAAGGVTVGVEMTGDRGAEAVLIHVITVIERWLVEQGVASATVRLAKRSYTLAV